MGLMSFLQVWLVAYVEGGCWYDRFCKMASGLFCIVIVWTEIQPANDDAIVEAYLERRLKLWLTMIVRFST